MLNRKLAEIDLSTRQIRVQEIPLELRRNFLGGRGLNMYLLYRHVTPETRAFSPENPLIFGAGLLTGLFGSRISISAKAAESEYLGDSNMGGDFGAALVHAGYSHLFITGHSDHPVYLFIHDGHIEFHDAAQLVGQDTLTKQLLIREKLQDPDVKIATIGVAGENRVRFANIMTGQKNAAGRTGMGAVMGSKNLLAVAVKGNQSVTISYPKNFIELAIKLRDQVADTGWGKILGKMGTPFLLNFSNKMGFISFRNHHDTTLGNHIETMKPEGLEKFTEGMVSCFGCTLHCRHRYNIKEGRFAGTKGEGPEYAGLGLGTNLGITKLDETIYLSEVCNKLGLDLISTSTYVGQYMDLFNQGILDEESLGQKLPWGDVEAIEGFLNAIANRKGFGDVAAEGVFAISRLPEKARSFIKHIKRVAIEPTDERTVKSFALGIAVATRGCCHMRSRPSVEVTNVPRELLSKLYGGDIGETFTDYTGKARIIWWHELLNAVTDSLGICRFVSVFSTIHGLQFKEYAELLQAATGIGFSPDELMAAGERIYTIERLFINREGLGRSDDTLPDIYFDFPVPKGPSKGEFIDRNKFQVMLDEYYEFHGWDEEGKPKDSTLKALGLDKLLPRASSEVV